MLNDLNHWWGADLSVGNTGDLATANDILRGQQRILRRLLTNPGDYIFQPEYGAGLPQWIGRTIDEGRITALIRQHLALEASVAQSPEPVIAIQQSGIDLTAFTVSINYTDAPSNSATVLSFNVSQ